MINLHNGKQQLHAELFGEHWKRADIPADNVVTLLLDFESVPIGVDESSHGVEHYREPQIL